MAEIIKIVGFGLVGIVLFTLIKNVKDELSVFVIVAVSAIISVYAFSMLGGVISEFQSILDRTSLDQDLFSGVLKVIGIGYVSEYGAGLCKDCGAESIGNKILLFGKICIFALSIPLLKALIEVTLGLAV